jgi:dipeptidyl aminopeptidase/acylaminoacyl peptidase
MKLLILAGSLGLVVILALFLYSWYILHIKVNLHSENSTINLPTGWVAKTQFVTNSDTQKIAFWYFPVERSKAVVILVHGYSIPGGKPQMIGHAQYLHDAGYSTVLVDLRSFGESEGDKITLGMNEWKDLEAVFDHIQSLPENKEQKIGFLGISMGAATSLVTAGETNKGDFVIASVPYADFTSLFRSQIAAVGFSPTIFYPFMKGAARIELGENYEHFTPSRLIKNIQVPVLLISAKEDEVLNSEDARTLYDLANAPKEYWEVDSHHDIFYEHPQEFKQKVLEFLQTYTK